MASPHKTAAEPETCGPRCSAYIAGTGFEVPDKVLTNADLQKLVDTSDEWIVERTGMKERRVVSDGQAASDLALAAARKALADSDTQASDIDLIIVGTVTGDMLFPSTSCVLQNKLGAARAAAMDVGAGCSGFIYALSTARQFIETGTYRNILVVGVEVLSKITDWTDRGTCVLLGDGAGAAVVKPTTDRNRGIIASLLGADGSRGPDLCMPAGGSRIPASVDSVVQRLHFLKMNGNAIFKVAVRNMAQTVSRLLNTARVRAEDVKLIIPHQANLRIIEAVAKLLRFPMERVFVNIQKYANTSSATTIIALDEARAAGLIRAGDLIVLVAFGAGLTWGGVLLRW
ncbi:MAG: ketoacyl-ACP synthase III [candidate division WOR-3 bacterium]|nr:MAG: ketoacyl-ACP synthase III [candidate division WOR-3 bacterium]